MREPKGSHEQMRNIVRIAPGIVLHTAMESKRHWLLTKVSNGRILLVRSLRLPHRLPMISPALSDASKCSRARNSCAFCFPKAPA